MKKRIDSVFSISLLISLVLSMLSVFFSDRFKELSDGLFAMITDNLSWLYLLVMFIFVVYIVGLACTKYGNIRLGPDDSKPEYSTFSWFAMLFCAGMGVGKT